MDPIIDGLEQMKSLPPDWDGYGASVIDHGAIRSAQLFVKLIRNMNSRIDDNSMFTAAGPNGGVLVGWNDPDTEWEVEIEADGTWGVLMVDQRSGESREEKIIPSGRQFSVKILEYLGHIASADRAVA